MVALQKGVVLPQGYRLPITMPYEEKTNRRVTQVMERIFPGTDKAALITVCANVNQSNKGLGARCIFHRTDDHSTLGCPTYLSHYTKVESGGQTKFITK
jgi:hypothetical protein